MKTKSESLKYIVFASMGQLVNTNMKLSFTALSKVHGLRDKYFSYYRVVLAYSLDLIWYKTIESYKKGLITSDDFHKRICKQLGINISKEIFFDKFNLMCQVDKKAISDINGILNLQQSRPFLLCILSATNESQFNYILKNFDNKLSTASSKEEVIEDKKLSLRNSENITFKTSFESHELSLIKLAQEVVRTHDNESTAIISLHNMLTTPKTLNLKHAAFTYVPYNDKERNSISLAATIEKGFEQINREKFSHVESVENGRNQKQSWCVVQ